MSINLIELAKNHFSDSVIDKIATSQNLDSNTARGLIGKVFPALMASFGDKAQTGSGATQLLDTIKEADSGILDNLTETFTGDNSSIIEKGQSTLSSLLNGRLEPLTNVLGNIPGLSAAKAGGLLGLLTPMLTGLLKKQVVGGGLNASGLTSLLDDQKEHISASLGHDLLGKLGFGSCSTGAADTACSVSGAASKVSGAAAGVAAGAAGALTGVAAGAAGKVTGAASGAAGAVTGAASGAAAKVSGAAGSIGSGAASMAGGTAAAATATTQKAGGGLLKLLPIAILALLAFLGIKMCKKSDIGGNLGDNLGDAVSGTAESTGSILNGLKDGVTDMSDKAVEAAGEATSVVVDTVKHTGDAVADMVPEVVVPTPTVVTPAPTPEVVVPAPEVVVPKITPTPEVAAPAFVPTPDADALSDKASALAQALSSVQAPENGNLNGLYKKIGKANNAEFLYRIPFATGETGVPNSHQSALKAKLQQADPAATLVTIGYADVRGDDALNKKLSYGRAKEVGTWIKSTLGNDKGLESFSMGETDRFSKTDFSKNRAVEVWQVK